MSLSQARMLEQVADWLLMMLDASACPQGNGGRNYLRLSGFGMERTLQQGLFVEFQDIWVSSFTRHLFLLPLMIIPQPTHSQVFRCKFDHSCVCSQADHKELRLYRALLWLLK